ncbi:MAG: hypothetical protein HYW89_04800 [Candidatus Sungiibacteriota bacterium]|uniref:FAD-binding FR-type domain-containing protein n=1 Tax=Candidatus Sungiibacteriota bacterium TaxID=2750080 RepID=A0A7T5RKB9_9BACT|nr:MAG: hypothetical protein HYW89_04800 [Candidatus Sungbacteria bacterium]
MASPKEYLQGQVIERRDLTPDLMIMKFALAYPLQFIPGQYCTLEIDGTARPYSIVSAPHESYLELFFELVPEKFRTEKSLTPRIWKLKVGDTISFWPKAKGAFVLDESYDTQVMVATVTGVAPYVSMIRTYRHGGYYHRYWPPRGWGWFILQGASYQDEFGYLDELRQYHDKGWIFYVPTVSRPQEERNHGWLGQTGRVNAIMPELFRNLFIEANRRTVCYLCGNEGMVQVLGNKKSRADKPRGWLFTTAGFSEKEVKEEIFF